MTKKSLVTTKTLAEISHLCGAELRGDPGSVVEGPAALVDAGPRQISFLAQPRYRDEFLATRAAAVLVPRGFESPREDLALLFCKDPSAAFTRSEEHTSELQSHSDLVCRLLLGEKT